MALTTLKDDLLQEFREECIMINDQLEMLDPLGTSLRKPAAQRLLSSTTLGLAEFGCYIVSLGGIAFIVMLHRIYPFTLIQELMYNPRIEAVSSRSNSFLFILALYGIVALLVACIFIIGRMAREIRLKNNILNQAGTDIKVILGQHLERKAAIDTLQQRHMLGVSGISVPAKAKVKVNEVTNPGYEEPTDEDAEEGNTVSWTIK